MYRELEDIPLFEQLKEHDLKYIHQFIGYRKFKRHEYVTKQGSGNNYFYILKSGQVKICCPSQQGKDIIFAILHEGEFFGEMSLIERSECCASAVCMQPCGIYTVRQDKFRKILREYPLISMRLLKQMSYRLRSNNCHIENLNFRNSMRRVMVVLNSLAEESGYRLRKSVVINKIPFEQEIAAMAGTSRETVSRTLSYLKDLDYINKTGRHIIINDYPRFYEEFCL